MRKVLLLITLLITISCISTKDYSYQGCKHPNDIENIEVKAIKKDIIDNDYKFLYYIDLNDNKKKYCTIKKDNAILFTKGEVYMEKVPD